jgi:uncharacterized protein YceH (UPF0502 family)
MTDENAPGPPPAEAKPRWQPLGAIDRRVAGVLAEKAKTTPDGYPMSLNAICNACNQKSNRHPVMNLAPDDVEESLDRLRHLGAVGMIEGYGRVTKYRHYLYEWLGVDKVEMAVMTELLLRGAQTEGELRGRAARMEPIADLSALRPVLSSLKAKGLVVPLTPEGRGHAVTHALYQPRELEHVKAQFAGGGGGVAPAAAEAGWAPPAAAPAPAPAPPSVIRQTEGSEALKREIEGLRLEISQLRAEVDDLLAWQSQADQQMRELRDALGG